jgi:hypothetical protein
MDYRRNGHPFYTQGINVQKGCYFCKCYCCVCCNCCTRTGILNLRENTDPDNPDFNRNKKSIYWSFNKLLRSWIYFKLYNSRPIKGSNYKSKMLWRL